MNNLPKLPNELYTSEETGTYYAHDDMAAAEQVFLNAFATFMEYGQSITDFEMDIILDTEGFWNAVDKLCAENGFEYRIVSKDVMFDDVYYAIELIYKN